MAVDWHRLLWRTWPGGDEFLLFRKSYAGHDTLYEFILRWRPYSQEWRALPADKPKWELVPLFYWRRRRDAR